MIGSVISLAVLWVVAFLLVSYWWLTVRSHHRRLASLDVRIHVNGIRGKSTVTRLVAAVLREGGFVTVAKTTGSAARVIGPLGEETPIKRMGAPTINEQIDIVREHVTAGTEALVIECMAVRPLYQEYSQEHMVRSDITIITNVREDHQEEMGESLEEIADSLATTTPRGGVLITAEDRPHLRERLRSHAESRQSHFVHADPARVSDKDMQGFDYLQFKENVAIGLAVAELLGVSRSAAIQGMWKSVPDVGVVRLRTYELRGKRVLWVPMFAANDRESVAMTLATLRPQFPPDATVIGILNNRRDRGRRAELFGEMVGRDIRHHLDHTLLLGAYEESVESLILDAGVPAGRVHRLGDTVKPDLDDMLDHIASLIPGEAGVLLGMVNIHTEQAGLLMAHFAEQDGNAAVDELADSRDPARLPSVRQRALRATRSRRDRP